MLKLVALLTAAAGYAAQGHSDHAHGPPRLGQVQFKTTCQPAAQSHFVRGLAWLHSFEYEEAERAFTAAAGSDPNCAIAYWGVAQSQYHPLWAPPSTAELAKGRAALERARAIAAKSPRERDYIEAMGAFYDGPERNHGSRVQDYVTAMKRLHGSYPDDPEAALLYALGLIAEGAVDSDPAFGREIEAASILNRVFASAPDHPGVAHYLIHGYDYPELAHLALPAARRYATIAPASAHAQHMPSHIFTRLGLWKEMVGSNRAAEAAAISYAKARGMAGAWDERLHAMDYLIYGHLQLGDEAAAKAVLEELLAITRVDPPNFKVAYAATAIPARFALERRKWAEAADLSLAPNTAKLVDWSRFRWAEGHLHLARAVGAARSGRAPEARAEVTKLLEIERGMATAMGEYDWRNQVTIQRQTAEAWVLFAEGKAGLALQVMRAAAEPDDSSEKHPVTPGSIAPAREQLGELLLELSQPAEAEAAFRAALKQSPGRRNAEAGLARAVATRDTSTRQSS